ncbi:serine hydrolase domain-containing protein [Paenibacillus sp. MMS18-CY102]|uniref:serine hydrolase domain-containing protein n=1 Tax=Paenibacillus sp. MMS18-CY102 TaxID=2682849 RepID=UPI0013667F23|nr:serine hydrolase domain-containing protein [Paenibacillus sp. MMS18-CY102]MWC29826.1 serine hydrolase [Paenibacillus sp. MMS18-CY102]
MRTKKLMLMLAIAAMMLSLLAPLGAAAAASDVAPLGYTDTQKAASEKAALLTSQYGTTSVQYALIDQGKIVVSGQSGINDAAGKKPLTANTMYGIGSTSKVFTAAAVMKLVDAGKINLDHPVVEYIPDFTMKDDRYKQITPRMLLNHSAGFYGSSLSNAFLFSDNDSYAHDTLLQQLSEQKLKADPGAYSVYCNDCFTLSEIMVEKVSGIGFTSFIHQYFSKPLGMPNTKTPQDHLDQSAMAALYFPGFRDQLPNETTNVIGTGGIYSTAEDLARFSQIFTGHETGILSADSVKAMSQPEYKKGFWPEDADTVFNYGLGWDSVNLFPFSDYGIQALAKGGDTLLYHASLVVLPGENMAAAVLSSGGSSTTNQMLASQILLHALKEKGAIDGIKAEKSYGKPTKADLPTELLNSAGSYGATNQLLTVAIAKSGELSISTPQAPGSPAQKFTYSKDGSFLSEDGNVKVNIVKAKNDRTYLWVRQYLSLPGLGQLALSEYSNEKLEPNDVPEETLAAWKARDGKRYYVINEKYTSVALLLLGAMKVQLFKEAPGYIIDQKITGPNTALADHQVPVMGSRDISPLNFYEQDGTEYLRYGTSLLVSEDALKPLYAGKHSSTTISANGYAKWYTIPDNAAGKTIKVSPSSKGSYAVYDENGTCVGLGTINSANPTVLPKNGTVMFAGEAGTKLQITLK